MQQLAAHTGGLFLHHTTENTMTYTIPDYLEPAEDDETACENLAAFILANTGNLWGRWSGHMKAADQRFLFGRFLGRGRITIDSEEELILHSRSVCFGLDRDTTHCLSWGDINCSCPQHGRTWQN